MPEAEKFGAKLDVCVVLLDDGYASTSLMPIEVFHSAGALWRELKGESPEPRFRVTTASIDGRPARSPYGGMTISPETSIAAVTKSDIVIVPTSGLRLDEKLIENSALLPWLRKHYEAGAYIAGVCMGAAYLAEAGLLDGKRATTHWAAAADIMRRWPQVHWQPGLLVTEDSRLLCSGGLTAAADVSLYLVEKLCGHEIAVQTAKALLLTMPRTHQSGYAVLPLSPPHTDDRIRAVEAWIQAHFQENHSTASSPNKPACRNVPSCAVSRQPPVARPQPIFRRCASKPQRPCSNVKLRLFKRSRKLSAIRTPPFFARCSNAKRA